MHREDSKREILTFPERVVSTCHRNIIFSADDTSYPCSFTMMCYDAQCVRLTCNGFVTALFEYSGFHLVSLLNLTLSLCFILPVLRKRLQRVSVLC